MKTINMVFMCDSVTTRQDLYVTFDNCHGILDQKGLSGYTKLGRVPGRTLKGWLRHGIEKLLLENGISVCHPLPKNTITNDRNKKYYEEDLSLGYHPRGECENQGGCPVYQIFGDLDRPSQLIVPSVYFHPSSGGGTAASNLNKIFGEVGKGRVELDHASPRKRTQSHQVYMSMEIIVGTYIEAPWNLVIREDNEIYEVLILKTLEFLFEKNKNSNISFMVGGDRTFGCGRAAAVQLSPEGKYLVKNRNVLGIANNEAELINEKFDKLVQDLKQKFPIQVAQ